MDFEVAQEKLERLRTGCVVAGVYGNAVLSPSATALDEASGGAIRNAAADLAEEPGSTLLLRGIAGVVAERVLLVGLGPADDFDELAYRTALVAAAKSLRSTRGVGDATVCLPELSVNGRGDAWKIEQAVRVVMEGLYRFDALKTRPKPPASVLRRLLFPAGDGAPAAAAQAAMQRAAAIAEGVELARDLGNMPGNLCTPAYLATQAQALGKRHGFEVEVLERRDLEALGMGAFLAVARGSPEPPKLIVMQWRAGGPGAQPIVLVGKGLTFDAGGISIKPALDMDEMKFDMCGAASVFGAMHAAALMKLPLDIVGIVVATENMPGGDAIKPGDVVKTMSGQTVEILDTDAEGRLVLCDALTYAEKFRPSIVVDIATLTGSIVSALGPVATGVFSTSDTLAREIVDAGDSAWDRAWHMPLWDEYQDALKSNFADLPNIGSHPGDAVIAACFLSRFTRAYPWVHLDIAGTASKGGVEKGATGRPVALLAHFLAARAGREITI